MKNGSLPAESTTDDAAETGQISERILNIAFVIGSDAHLEIASELAAELRGVTPRAVLWGISRRRFKPDGKEFDQAVMRATFSHVVTPVRVPFRCQVHSFAARLARKLNLPETFFRLPLLKSYPTLFREGKIRRFDFVFSLNDRMFPAIDFVRLFQAVDVPVALVQDTLRRYDTGGRSDQGVFNGQGGCDIVYAWGDTSLEYYRRVGVNPGRIVAAGSPRMDRYVRTAAELPSSQEIRRAKNLPLDGWVVFIATNTVYRKTLERPMFIADYFYCIGQAIEWCREIGAFVILKPHGNLLKDYLRWEVPQWIESLPHARYWTDASLAEAAKACDAALVFNSTVALELALLGKPVGMLAVDRYSHGVEYLERGLCRRVDSAADLEALVASKFAVSRNNGLASYLAERGCSAEVIVGDMLQKLEPRSSLLRRHSGDNR